MKLIHEEKFVPFYSVKVGVCFLYKENLYIKNWADSLVGSGTSLNTGEVGSMANDTKVIPVDAKVTWRKKQ